jgi:hypothetical protein
MKSPPATIEQNIEDEFLLHDSIDYDDVYLGSTLNTTSETDKEYFPVTLDTSGTQEEIHNLEHEETPNKRRKVADLSKARQIKLQQLMQSSEDEDDTTENEVVKKTTVEDCEECFPCLEKDNNGGSRRLKDACTKRKIVGRSPAIPNGLKKMSPKKKSLSGKTASKKRKTPPSTANQSPNLLPKPRKKKIEKTPPLSSSNSPSLKPKRATRSKK